MNLFNEKGALMPFYIDGVFCDKYNNIWNDKWQDALLEDIRMHYIWSNGIEFNDKYKNQFCTIRVS